MLMLHENLQNVRGYVFNECESFILKQWQGEVEFWRRYIKLSELSLDSASNTLKIKLWRSVIAGIKSQLKSR